MAARCSDRNFQKSRLTLLANTHIVAIIFIMSRKKLIAIIALVVVIGATASFYMIGGVEKVKAAFQPKNQQETVSLEGTVLCLPTKEGADASALSCAMGLKTADGKYYGLGNSSNTKLSEAAGTDAKVKVSGVLQPSANDTYQMEGIVTISHFDFSK